MVTMDKGAMVPAEIAPVVSVMVTANICPLQNIFILLVKIYSSIFMEQPVSYGRSVFDLLWVRLGFIISHILPLNIMLPKQTLLNTNLVILLLQKETSLRLQLLHAIAKPRNKVMIIRMTFNWRASTALWLWIQRVLLILEKFF